MKRVCIYCPTWESGGIEAFLHNILCHMNLSELKVDIVTEAMKKSVFTQDLLERGVTFRRLSGSPRRVLKNWCLFAHLMEQENYDVIHLNLFQALPMVYLLFAKRKGIPLRIVHSHNTQLRKSRTRIAKMIIHKVASLLFSGNATTLWACSASAAGFLFPSGLLKKRGYRFIPNGIDLHQFRFDIAVRERMRNQLHVEEAFVIGNIGRLCYQKNQSFLIDIFARLYIKDPTARLLLVGEGDELDKLKEKARQLSILDAVIFYGTTSHVERLLWTMDVFVFPSTFEGLGIAAIEAQAAGLPTICSNSVPQEAIASGLAVRMGVHATMEEWCKVITAQKCPRSFYDAFEQLKRAGFHIVDVSKEIEKVYRREVSQEAERPAWKEG